MLDDNVDSTKRQKILAIDDDVFNLRIVRFALEKEGYQVLTAVSGEDAIQIIERSGLPHLAVVDFHMPPGMSGFEFCRRVQEYSDLPVIMLTAVNHEETIIEGLNKYAEDYIVKPFSPSELVARIRRVLRRIGDFAYTLDPITEVDEFLKIDFPNRRALIQGEPTLLTPTETRLLYILMRNAGQVVTTDFILRRLWPMDNSAYEDRLHVHMHRLRKKIEDEARPPYITSSRGTGYVFKDTKKKKKK